MGLGVCPYFKLSGTGPPGFAGTRGCSIWPRSSTRRNAPGGRSWCCILWARGRRRIRPACWCSRPRKCGPGWVAPRGIWPGDRAGRMCGRRRSASRRAWTAAGWRRWRPGRWTIWLGTPISRWALDEDLSCANQAIGVPRRTCPGAFDQRVSREARRSEEAKEAKGSGGQGVGPRISV